VLSWGFKAEGIHVVMPDPTSGAGGVWTGWWEGVVDLVPPNGGPRSSSIEKLLKKPIPRAFPEAASSAIRLIAPEEASFRVDPLPGRTERQWRDGREREVMQWDLTDGAMAGKDLRFWWHDEGDYRHRESSTTSSVGFAHPPALKLEAPYISISLQMARSSFA
jgi:phosphatidylinositol glycan class T